ncbi:helix-turn-helix transcriptional regulator [Blastococcus brunescens]|uniref:Helix-turn-helix domain-containing protein n=1 Tax=Blastococcus brunescens TaxID=1564165 RepID=A0ABZ1AW43_9ACTN|nr:helix-turn-helix domain-containing protein [Blastococcus sp. BMG 8361]WRL61893.1 helix-turn-helix domain-containing protein [Blastococcus sp. BMG 8361]
MESAGSVEERAHPRASATADDGRTRDRVSSLLLEHGPQTATELAARLGISPAAVRRHLDSLVAAGRLEERLTRDAHRGRGRPARRFHLTDAGRSAFPHAYDDLALTALRYVAASGGPDAVRAVAEQQLAGLERRASDAVQQAVDARPDQPVDRAQALAAALTAEGYAATASAISGGGSSASTTARWRTWPRSSPAVRGRDRGDRPARGHPRPAAGHDRPRRRDLHHAHPRATAQPEPHPRGEQISPRTPCTR